jgi:uroporphyrinogen-III synthase
MKCLITRSEPHASELASRISELGGTSSIVTVMDIEPIPLSGADRSCILDLDLFSFVIVVSANAAHYLGELIDQYWPQLPLGLQWVAIGQATAKALTQAIPELSLRDVHCPEGTDSEALLALSLWKDVSDRRVLLVKGLGGRTHIQEQLAEQGANVSELPLYQRKALKQNKASLIDAMASSPKYIQIASGDSFQSLLVMLGKLSPEVWGCSSSYWLVPSQRVAGLLESHGLSRSKIVVCQGASNNAVLSAIVENERH